MLYLYTFLILLSIMKYIAVNIVLFEHVLCIENIPL